MNILSMCQGLLGIPTTPDCWRNLEREYNVFIKCLSDGDYQNDLKNYPSIEKIKYVAEEILLEGVADSDLQNRTYYGKAKTFLNAYDACYNNLNNHTPGIFTEEHIDQVEGEGKYTPNQIALLRERLARENVDKGGIVGAYYKLKCMEERLLATQFFCKSVRHNALSEECKKLSEEFVQLMEKRDTLSSPQEEDSASIDPISEQYKLYLSKNIQATEEIESLKNKIKEEEEGFEALTQRIRAVDPIRIGEEPSIFKRIYLFMRYLLHWINLWRQPDRNQIDTLLQERADKWGGLTTLNENLEKEHQKIKAPFSTILSTQSNATRTKTMILIDHLKEHIECFRNPLVQSFMLHYLEPVEGRYLLSINGDNIIITLNESITTEPLSPLTPFPVIPMLPSPLTNEEGGTDLEPPPYPPANIDDTSSDGDFCILSEVQNPPHHDLSSIHEDDEPLTPVSSLPTIPLKDLNGYRNVASFWIQSINGAKFSLPQKMEMRVDRGIINFVKNPPTIDTKSNVTVAISSIFFHEVNQRTAKREITGVILKGGLKVRETVWCEKEINCTLTDINVLISRLFSIEAMGIAG